MIKLYLLSKIFVKIPTFYWRFKDPIYDNVFEIVCFWFTNHIIMIICNYISFDAIFLYMENDIILIAKVVCCLRMAHQSYLMLNPMKADLISYRNLPMGIPNDLLAYYWIVRLEIAFNTAAMKAKQSSGAHFTKDFSIGMQIWWKFYSALIQLIIKWWLGNFAWQLCGHGMCKIL